MITKLNSFFAIIIIHYFNYCFSQEHQDTLIIHPINWSTPSPVGWNAQYSVNVNFPKSRKLWKKIIMVHTLKCDNRTSADSYPCGEWDYIWNTLISSTDDSTSEVFSIGSFVTPYGKQLDLGGEDGWAWSYDITDYAPILKGTKKVTAGNNQELLDLKFFFIKGIPARNILKVENIYPFGEYKYFEVSDDLKLKQKAVNLLSTAEGFKIKTIISGHGHEGPRNCCEWDSKTHTYYLNNWELFRWNVWKDCGNNPLYPQGGTWPFDRAGWCPGTKVDEYQFELTPFVYPGESILIDYGIEPYSDNGEGNGFFFMTHQLFSYGEPNYETEVELLEIITPSSKKTYRRLNPDLSQIKIIIKNNGKFEIRSLKIEYGLVDGVKSVYNWVGDLKFLKEKIIDLPKPDWSGLRIKRDFFVQIKNPNNNVDQDPSNNKMVVSIRIPKIFPKKFKMKLQTNNLGRSRENSFTITDDKGYVMYSGEKFSDSTKYEYSIFLEDGDYQFSFIDSKEDGISKHWWNKSSPEKIGVDGAIMFTDIKDNILHKFDPDFGQEIRFNFRVGALP